MSIRPLKFGSHLPSSVNIPFRMDDDVILPLFLAGRGYYPLKSSYDAKTDCPDLYCGVMLWTIRCLESGNSVLQFCIDITTDMPVMQIISMLVLQQNFNLLVVCHLCDY